MKIEAQGIAAKVNEIKTRSKAGDSLTHATDSTTKKHVGKFNVAGIHFNKVSHLPLPTVPVSGESRDQIAEQAALGFELLGASCEPPVSPAELYGLMDQHLTDSVFHNKFLGEDVPKLLNLETEVGQVNIFSIIYFVYYDIYYSNNVLITGFLFHTYEPGILIIFEFINQHNRGSFWNSEHTGWVHGAN